MANDAACDRARSDLARVESWGDCDLSCPSSKSPGPYSRIELARSDGAPPRWKRGYIENVTTPEASLSREGICGSSIREVAWLGD